MRAPILWTLTLAWTAALLTPLAHASTPSPDPFALLGFVENRGQAPQEVFAYTPTRAGVSLVTRDGRLIHRLAVENGKTTRLEERFADEPLRPRSLAQAPTRVSFFTGATPKGWRSDIPTHEIIELGGTAPGVRVQLLARPGNVEKRFHLAPGTDPDAISIRLQGARSLSVEEDGRLRVETAEGTVHFTAPVAWQPRPDGGQDPVEVAYVTRDEHYGFRLGAHDPTREVVIDPLLGTALLRDSVASVDDLAVGPFGNVFIAGRTSGSTLQDLATGYDTTADGFNTGETTGYIAKFSRDLTQLLALTFLGGVSDNTNHSAYNAFTSLTALAIGPQGDVFVAGITNTEDFPVIDPGSKTSNALKQSFGGYEFVVARLSNDLSQLTASAYLSGSGNEGLNPPYNLTHRVDLALAADGQHLYLAGTSNSSDLPTNQGSAGDNNQPAYMAVDPHPVSSNDLGYDCYLAQLPLDLTTANATWAGNNATDGDWRVFCELVDTDSSGSVFVAGRGYGQFEAGVTGHARSQSGRDQSLLGDWGDIVVARFSPDLRTLHNGTFLGSFDHCFECDTPDRPWDMVVTDAAEVILVGQTPLPLADYPDMTLFPTTTGALIDQATTTGKNTTVGFVARLDNSLQLQAATLLHLCPQGDQGTPDCDLGGSGYATAVDFYSHQDTNGQTRRDIYVTYWQDTGAGSSKALTTAWPGAYLNMPAGKSWVGPLSLHRLSEDLGTRLAATDLMPLDSDSYYPKKNALVFSETYNDGTGNQNDPRIYVGLNLENGLQHPEGFIGPAGTDLLGNPYPDKGPYLVALTPELASGDAPALSLAPGDPIDLGYLPEATRTAATTLALTNSGTTSLTVYDAQFEDNGLGAGWHFGTIDGCLTAGNSYNFPITLAPGTSCNLYVYADSSVLDPVTFQARLHLVTNDPNGAVLTSPEITVRATPLLLTYTGSSIYAIDYLGEGLDFGSVSVGTGLQETITARSRIDNLALGQVALDDAAGPFTIEQDDCSNKTLNDGDTCSVTVRYQPTAAGGHETTLSFANTTASGGTWVALRLHGTTQDGSNSSGNGGSGSSGNTGGGGNTGSGGGTNTGGGNSGGGLFGAIGPLPLLAGLFLAALARRRRRP